MTEAEKIHAAIEFLMRSELKGHETSYFNEVIGCLNELSENISTAQK